MNYVFFDFCVLHHKSFSFCSQSPLSLFYISCSELISPLPISVNIGVHRARELDKTPIKYHPKRDSSKSF
jgi:hypothetical protein